MKKLLLSFALLFVIGCTCCERKATWENQPRDSNGRWISELTDYAKKNGITQEAAARAKVPFEQYVYDFSVSHGPALDKKAKADYDKWLEYSKKVKN